jgi:hypothetical protein
MRADEAGGASDDGLHANSLRDRHTWRAAPFSLNRTRGSEDWPSRGHREMTPRDNLYESPS